MPCATKKDLTQNDTHQTLAEGGGAEQRGLGEVWRRAGSGGQAQLIPALAQ